MGKHATITTASHIGARDENQDRHEVAESKDGRQLAVVCDGLGGENAGSTAAVTAAASFVQSWKKLPTDGPEQMPHALIVANSKVHDRIENNSCLRGMATTLLAVEVDADGAEWISVGDSPLWHWSWLQWKLVQLNQRHNPPGQPHKLTSAVTGRKIRHIDRGTIVPAVGDLLILASDGLDTLDRQALLEAIKKGRERRDETLAAHLVQSALDAQAPRQDNVTAIVLEIIAPEG